MKSNLPPDSEKLPASFYQENHLSVARNLLGKIFVHRTNDGLLFGRIVEIEAYSKTDDEASHSFKGKTKRNEVMFSGGGKLYVYFTYGIHFCANVVTGGFDSGEAVLIRAIQPIFDTNKFSLNRYKRKFLNEKEIINLTNGPGKICMAFDINKDFNGLDLCGDKVFILKSDSSIEEEIITAKRIGIKKSVDLPWRFYFKDNPFVSK